jgi:hypothetical protein
MTADNASATPAHLPCSLPKPDRRIDAAVHSRFRDFVLDLNSGPVASGVPIPYYSVSLDAVSDLVKDLLPDWIWCVSAGSKSHNIWLIPDGTNPDFGPSTPDACSDARDWIDKGPGLKIEFAPHPRGAMGLLAILLEVLDALEAGRAPDPDIPSARRFFKEAIEARELPYRQDT